VAPPPPALLADIDAFDAEAGVPYQTVAQPDLALDADLRGKLGHLELEQLEHGLGQGKRAVQVRFEPSSDKAARGVTIKVVREQIPAPGEIVKVVPIATQGRRAGPVWPLPSCCSRRQTTSS
jgi:two-component system chemotaxis sensor kinase CheA